MVSNQSHIYTYCLNNPLIFADPSGYMPQYFQDEYELANRNDGGDYYKNEGGVSGGWNPWGWVNKWGQSSGVSFGSAWTQGKMSLSALANSHYGGYWSSTMSSPHFYNSHDYARFENAASSLQNTVSAATNSGRSWNNPLVQARGFDNHIFQYNRETGLFYAPWTDIVVDPLAILAQSMVESLSAGSPVGRGVSLPSWLSWTNNSINTVGYGAFAAGGSAGMLSSGAVRYYSNAWKGNQYIKTFNLTKIGANVGYGASALGFGFGIYNFTVSDKSWGDYGQLGVSLLSSGLTLSGYTAPIGIGIGFIDVAGGFNGFYNYLDTEQQFYKGTGGVMLPVNGIPTFIPLRKP